MYVEYKNTLYCHTSIIYDATAYAGGHIFAINVMK